MRKLLSIVALSFAMAMAFIAYAPNARAGALTNGVLALKSDQANIVEKARYRCWWRHGYRHCGYRHGWRKNSWRHHRSWRHRHWRKRHWRNGAYYRRNTYAKRRHYYYNSYAKPVQRPGYCIGLCWW